MTEMDNRETEAARRRAAADRFKEWGTIGPEQVYVTRPADRRLTLLLSEGRDCHVTGSRQSGKSSLVARAAERLEQAGSVVLWLDLGNVPPDESDNAATWSKRLVTRLRKVVPPETTDQVAVPDGDPSLAEVLLAVCEAAPDRKVVLVLDELDKLETHPACARVLLEPLRALAQGWERGGDCHVQLVTIGVKSPARLFADLGGLAGAKELGGEDLWLDDFDTLDTETIDTLAAGFGGMRNADEVARVALRYAGGYPNATTWCCRVMILTDLAAHADGRVDQRDLLLALHRQVSAAKRNPPMFLQVLDNYVSDHGVASALALNNYLLVLAGKPVPYDARSLPLSLLPWAGLCRVDEEGMLQLRCELLTEYFDRQWAESKKTSLGTPIRRRSQPLSDKRVCLLTTGGTIGMVEYPDGTVRPPRLSDSLRFEGLELIADVTPYEICRLDSADMGPDQWSQLAKDIARLRVDQGFDGFVVAHGTDTLAYSASAVAFALGDRLSFPVVFTGSQTTIDVEHGDALTNLLRACLVATQPLPEVVVCFGEQVLRGCRTQKKDDRRFEAFESPAFPSLGLVAEEVHLLPQNFRRGWEAAGGPLDLHAEFADGIMQVAQTPGSHADFYLPALDPTDERGRPLVRGLVVQSLGAANVPTRGPYDLVPLIEKAVALDIPVVVTNAYPVHQRNFTRYSPAAAALRAGATPTGNMTTAAAVAKLSWLIADVDARVSDGAVPEGRRHRLVGERMGRDEVGEVSDIVVAELPQGNAIHSDQQTSQNTVEG